MNIPLNHNSVKRIWEKGSKSTHLIFLSFVTYTFLNLLKLNIILRINTFLQTRTLRLKNCILH